MSPLLGMYPSTPAWATHLSGIWNILWALLSCKNWLLTSVPQKTSGIPQEQGWILILSSKMLNKSNISVGKVDSTSQCEGCQSGQLLSITEKIRKVGRGQITGGIAGYGEDCGGYSLSVIGSHWRVLSKEWHDLIYVLRKSLWLLCRNQAIKWWRWEQHQLGGFCKSTVREDGGWDQNIVGLRCVQIQHII